MEKIEKGVFIDFKELFSNNIAPVSQLHQLSHSFSLMQLSGHMRDITNPLSWVYFLLILAASVEDKKTQELMAFIVLGWHSYCSPCVEPGAHEKRREGGRNSHVFNEKLLFLHILMRLLLIE